MKKILIKIPLAEPQCPEHVAHFQFLIHQPHIIIQHSSFEITNLDEHVEFLYKGAAADFESAEQAAADLLKLYADRGIKTTVLECTKITFPPNTNPNPPHPHQRPSPTTCSPNPRRHTFSKCAEIAESMGLSQLDLREIAFYFSCDHATFDLNFRPVLVHLSHLKPTPSQIVALIPIIRPDLPIWTRTFIDTYFRGAKTQPKVEEFKNSTATEIQVAHVAGHYIATMRIISDNYIHDIKFPPFTSREEVYNLYNFFNAAEIGEEDSAICTVVTVSGRYNIPLLKINRNVVKYAEKTTTHRYTLDSVICYPDNDPTSYSFGIFDAANGDTIWYYLNLPEETEQSADFIARICSKIRGETCIINGDHLEVGGLLIPVSPKKEAANANSI